MIDERRCHYCGGKGALQFLSPVTDETWGKTLLARSEFAGCVPCKGTGRLTEEAASAWKKAEKKRQRIRELQIARNCINQAIRVMNSFKN